MIQAELRRRGMETDPVGIQAALDEISAVGSLASLGDRLLGQILDSLVAVLCLAAGVLLFADISEQVGRIAVATGFGFAVLYILFADGLRGGQSYGKRVVKTAVVDAASGAAVLILAVVRTQSSAGGPRCSLIGSSSLGSAGSGSVTSSLAPS